MSYCTKQQMIERFGNAMLIAATDREALPTGAIDDAALSRAIADADALIDGYLGVRYALPLAGVPSLVTDLSLTVSIYKLHATVANEKVTADYRDAVKLLTQISQGIVRLDIEGAEPTVSGGGEVLTNAPERPLSAATMKGYI